MPATARVLFLATLVSAGCSAPDIDYSELPELVRIITDPPAADVQLEGSLARFVTPCDVSPQTLAGRVLLIEKAGYAPFRGTLADIPAGERGTFKLTLRKL